MTTNNKLMDNLKVDINVSPDLQNLMDQNSEIAPLATKKGLRMITKEGSKLVKNKIRSLGLVRSGKLAKSVRGSTTNNKSFIGTKLWYAHFLEGGTKPHKIKPKKAKGLFIGSRFVKSVRHPGIKPYRFAEETFEQMQGSGMVDSLFAQGVREALEELSS